MLTSVIVASTVVMVVFICAVAFLVYQRMYLNETREIRQAAERKEDRVHQQQLVDRSFMEDELRLQVKQRLDEVLPRMLDKVKGEPVPNDALGLYNHWK